MLKPGDQAPDFSVPDSDMQVVSLRAQLGGHKVLVLYFYPKDDTPGCTIEALEFTELEDEFAAQGALILGVSRDTCVSHGAFRDKHGISVRLLADIEGEMCEAYGVWQAREAHGERKMGILRSTFVIDGQGIIRYVLYDVKPKGHAAAVLELVGSL
jgi:thioredoxin-dependent peroxiredoxin